MRWFIIAFVLYFGVSKTTQYEIPAPKIKVLRPKGLKVSIPDEDGIELFAFHGNVNKKMCGLEAGEMSKDVVKKHKGKWTFVDNNVEIKKGDTLYYWLYVIKNGVGYRLDNASYTYKGKHKEDAVQFPEDDHSVHRSRRTLTRDYMPIYGPPKWMRPSWNAHIEGPPGWSRQFQGYGWQPRGQSGYGHSVWNFPDYRPPVNNIPGWSPDYRPPVNNMPSWDSAYNFHGNEQTGPYFYGPPIGMKGFPNQNWKTTRPNDYIPPGETGKEKGKHMALKAMICKATTPKATTPKATTPKASTPKVTTRTTTTKVTSRTTSKITTTTTEKIKKEFLCLQDLVD